MTTILRRAVLFVFLSVLAACGGGEEAPINTVPVADAGPDRTVPTGSVVTLDGSGSIDADDDPLTHAWVFAELPTGSAATLSDPAAVTPSFTADLEGTYVVSLTVHDGISASVADTVTVTATTGNSPPVADAGPDQEVSPGSVVTLDGSGSSDADGDVLTYAWSLTDRPAGSAAALSDPGAGQPSFTADLQGTYVATLVVNDGTEASAADTVTVTCAFKTPAGHVAVDFTIDDTANGTYDAEDGLAWKGSFRFDPQSRVLTFDGAWSGPFPLLYDDGSWTEGGHEPEGAVAGDSLWGVTVFVSTAESKTFEYGAIRGSIDGSDGEWIWRGSNGVVTVPAGAAAPIDAPGLVIPAHGTVDLRLTLDVSASGANLASPFQGADYTGQVAVKGSAWRWMEVGLPDDGTRGDETSGDGIYTFALSENRGEHEGLLHSGDVPEFVFVLAGVEYKDGGTCSPIGVSASVNDGSGWASAAVDTCPSGNTCVTVP